MTIVTDEDVDALLEQLYRQESELANLPAASSFPRIPAPGHLHPRIQEGSQEGVRRLKLLRDMDVEERREYVREYDLARGLPELSGNIAARRAALEMNIESLKDQIGRLVRDSGMALSAMEEFEFQEPAPPVDPSLA